MRSVTNSVDTVNAAATAIVTADARVQPTTVQKRRWASCWSTYWCFGHQKNSKRFGHAVLVPEPAAPGTATAAATVSSAPSTTITLPFIAPPSSPASFLQSDPSSAIQSPAGFTNLSANNYSPRGPGSIFAIGPYAYETQLVSPPVFSTYTTQPSTAPFTPPPESVLFTTPSSPEVPFAQLLTSSLERTQRNGGVNQKFGFSHQYYTGSPGGQLISPGSAVSYSGTSSPFTGKPPMLGIGEGSMVASEQLAAWKWGSRIVSGSVTPDGVGLRSRLGSGSVTPDGVGLSRLGSGCLTPDGVGPPSQDNYVPTHKNGVAGLPRHDETVADHRVSFELTGEDVARCLANKSATQFGTLSRFPGDSRPEDSSTSEFCKTDNNSSEMGVKKVDEEASDKVEKEPCFQRQRSVTLGSAKEFNFDNTNGSVPSKLNIRSEWWANEKVAGSGKESKSGNSWSFFPMLQPERWSRRKTRMIILFLVFA